MTMCIHCKQPWTGPQQGCDECRMVRSVKQANLRGTGEQRRAYDRARFRQRIAAGLCVDCTRKLPGTRWKRCLTCRRDQLARKKARSQEALRA